MINEDTPGNALIELETTNVFGAKIFHVQQTDSTMKLAKALVSTGCEHGTVVVAGHQTAGRGRGYSRVWQDKPGECLMFTLVLRWDHLPKNDIIPLRTGLGLMWFLKKNLVSPVALKWPNDVLVNSSKIGGILCEADASCILVGIGLNVLQADFPQYNTRATSMFLEGCNKEPLEMLDPLLFSLHEAFTAEQVISELNMNLYGRGQNSVFSCGAAEEGKTVQGIITEIAPDGQLVLKTPSGTRHFGAGEISSVIKD